MLVTALLSVICCRNSGRLVLQIDEVLPQGTANQVRVGVFHEGPVRSQQGRTGEKRAAWIRKLWGSMERYVLADFITLVQSAVLRSHVVCLSVCLSVTLVICDHIGWKLWKLIARTISPTPSLFVAERRSTYCKGNMGEFCGD